METKHINEMKYLKKRLGYDAAKCGYDHDPTPMKGTAMNIQNTVLFEMQGRRVGDPFCNVDDIVKGVARLDHYNESGKQRNIPLSTKRLYAILQCMELINTREVKRMFDLGDRQARRYVKACKIMMPFLEDVLTEDLEGVDLDDYVMYGHGDSREGLDQNFGRGQEDDDAK